MFWNTPPKKSLQQISSEFALTVPMPKTNEYRTILTLLDDAERWRNVGDKELEKNVWKMIAEKASLYSDGMRENYDKEYFTKCGVFKKPEFPEDRDTSKMDTV